MPRHPLRPTRSSSLASSRGGRPGLSLLEVIVSLAIFMMSLVALQYLMSNSLNMAVEAQWRNRGLLLAQSKMAEMQAGTLALQGVSEQPFAEEEDKAYSFSVETASGPTDGLSQVTVRVSRPRNDGSKVEVALHRFLFDPTRIGSTQDQPPSTQGTTAPEGTEAAASSSSSTTTPSTTTKGK
jgi:general secretion pathway protein I